MRKILTILTLTMLTGCASMMEDFKQGWAEGQAVGDKYWGVAIGTASGLAERDREMEMNKQAPTTITVEQERQCVPIYNQYGKTGCLWQ